MANPSSRHLLFVITCAPLGACHEPVPPDPAPIVWEGEYIELATHDETLACGGSRAYLDTFIGALHEDLDLEWKGTPIRYYLLSTEELVELDFCSPGARCIWNHHVYTDRSLDLHETVHAVRAESLGQPLPGITYFEEGLAEAYSFVPLGIGPEQDVYAGLESISDLDAYLPGSHYGVAGHFTRFLIDTHGVREHVAFVDDQVDIRTIDALEQRFAEHFDAPLETLVDEYRAEYPRCSDFARARHLLECAQPPVQLGSNGIRLEYDLTCGDPEVLGPLDGRMWRSFTIEVTEPGSYRFTNAISPFDFQFEIVDCDRGCRGDVDYAVESPGTIFTTFDLQPGRYLIRLSREVDQPGRAGIDILDQG